MKKMKLAVIGCGDITRFTLAFSKLNRKIQIDSLTDINIDRAKSYGKFFKKAKVFSDYKVMAKESKPDAVYIALPHYLHFEVMDYFIDKKIHILCEKPITIKDDEAKALVAKAKENGVKLGINYQYRYDKAVYTLKRNLEENALGDIFYGLLHVPWSRSINYFTNAPWHASIEKAGGGTLLTQGSHLLDLTLWLLEKETIKEVKAYTNNFRYKDIETEDTALASVIFESGKFINIVSTMALKKEEPLSLSLYGEKGQVHYKATFIPSLKTKGLKLKKIKMPSKGLHALQRSLNAFTSWVLYDKEYLISGDDSLKVLALVNSIYLKANQ